MIDTLTMADELARDGVFSRDQAERLARVSAVAATENLVTKTDLERTKADLEHAIQATKADLEHALEVTRSDLESTFQVTRTDLERALHVNRAEIETAIRKSNRDTVKWFAGIMVTHGVAVVAVTVALVRLLS